jgi:two-component system CheB/CheR fusion protein
MMMVDQSLKILRFTPDAERVFNLIQTDRGRPITDINLNIDINLASVINEVMVTQKKKEIEFRDPGDHTYSLQIHPYRRDNLVAGAVLLVFEMNSVSNS